MVDAYDIAPPSDNRPAGISAEAWKIAGHDPTTAEIIQKAMANLEKQNSSRSDRDPDKPATDPSNITALQEMTFDKMMMGDFKIGHTHFCGGAIKQALDIAHNAFKNDPKAARFSVAAAMVLTDEEMRHDPHHSRQDMERSFLRNHHRVCEHMRQHPELAEQMRSGRFSKMNGASFVAQLSGGGAQERLGEFASRLDAAQSNTAMIDTAAQNRRPSQLLNHRMPTAERPIRHQIAEASTAAAAGAMPPPAIKTLHHPAPHAGPAPPTGFN